MSAEEAVTDALQQPVDQNEQSAEDAKNLLASLDAEKPDTADDTLQTESNGATDGGKLDNTAEDKEEERKENRGKGRDHRNRDRDDRRREGNTRGGRGGRGGNFQRGRGNIRSVLTRDEKSDNQVDIRKQVEFYFSDSNLPMDQFLLGKVGGSENNAVDLDIIRSFKRMRHFEPLEAIIAALKDSKLVRLVDNDTKVQRKQPLPKTTDDGVLGKNGNADHVRVYEDKAMPRSVYVKGFGEEVPSTQFDIEAWFSQFGPTNAIRLRRTDDKLFKSSVFAEFESENLAKTFLALDPKPTYKDRELQIMSKKDYCEKKVEDIKAGKIPAGKDRPQGRRESFRGRGGRFSDRRPRRDDDDRDWRTRREEDRKNGFRDGKREDRDDRDKRGGRERRRSIEKDDRGIPLIKTGEDTPRDKAKSDAIAQAKAAVDAENKKEEADDAKTATATNDKASEAKDEVKIGDGAVEASKKREREEDAGTHEAQPTKRVDTKAEA